MTQLQDLIPNLQTYLIPDGFNKIVNTSVSVSINDIKTVRLYAMIVEYLIRPPKMLTKIQMGILVEQTKKYFKHASSFPELRPNGGVYFKLYCSDDPSINYIGPFHSSVEIPNENPDYIIYHEPLKQELIKELKK